MQQYCLTQTFSLMHAEMSMCLFIHFFFFFFHASVVYKKSGVRE